MGGGESGGDRPEAPAGARALLNKATAERHQQSVTNGRTPGFWPRGPARPHPAPIKPSAWLVVMQPLGVLGADPQLDLNCYSRWY